MRFRVPLRLRSLTNLRLSWQARAGLAKRQRKAVQRVMAGKPIPPLPLVVIMTRVGPGRLDDDNLDSACKHVRDQIAAEVGEDDGSPLFTWVCQQRSDGPGVYAVEVEIMTRGDGLT